MQWGEQTLGTHTAERSSSGERYVLVVDDNPGIRRMLSRALGRHDFRPVEASSIAEAVAFADSHTLSAVILDLHLGPQCGLELLAMLRVSPRHRATPVMILTGSGVVTSDEEALIRRNAAHLFYKPQPLNELVEHIDRLAVAEQQAASVEPYAVSAQGAA
jgi:DNA-binding response OmpR family regulator